MHILITNDDGISSVGLRALVEHGLKRGHKITVSAPLTQQSAMSHRLTLFDPLMVKQEYFFGDQVKAYAISGSPADCVRVAGQLTDTPFDFCISGINDGENAGSAIYYSGTFAAAREARMNDIKAMAVSIVAHAEVESIQNLAQKAILFAEHFYEQDIPRLAVININAPNIKPSEVKEMKMCFMSQAFFVDKYVPCKTPRGQDYFWLGKEVKMETPEEGSDYDLLRKGHITCTLIGIPENLNNQLHVDPSFLK